MSAGNVRQLRKRRAAPAPAPRSVPVIITDGPFAGWEATCRVDMPARWLSDLESGNVDRMMGALDRIVLDHNFPDQDGNVAASMADVDPYTGLIAVVEALTTAIGSLPPR